jgi:uracil-DNA glycosylase
MTRTARPPSRSAPAGEARAGRGDRSLKRLRDGAGDCRDCDLWKDATQTVFGEGSEAALRVASAAC